MDSQIYNPMIPEQDTKQKFQWCIHTVARSSHHFKTLTDDNWSIAGFIPSQSNTEPKHFLFYWRKLISNSNPFTSNKPFSFKPIIPTTTLPAVGFNFNFSPKNNFSPKSKCSTPALEVEEEEGLDSSENQEMDPLDVRPSSPLCSIDLQITNTTNDDRDVETPYWNNTYSTSPASFFDTQNNFVSHDKKWR